uniref:Uncharacterized protein n=1 Tax=Micrurus carvalhoi TaxID=3147026 RepID=A0A2H6MVD7_9SAUR
MIYIRNLEQLYYCLLNPTAGRKCLFKEIFASATITENTRVPSQTNLLIKPGNHNELLAQLLLLALVISSNLCDILSHIAFSSLVVIHCNRFGLLACYAMPYTEGGSAHTSLFILFVNLFECVY